MIITEIPDNKPRDAKVDITIIYLNKVFEEFKKTEQAAETKRGKILLTIISLVEAIAIEAKAEGTTASKALHTGYPISVNFNHVEQISKGLNLLS